MPLGMNVIQEDVSFTIIPNTYHGKVYICSEKWLKLEIGMHVATWAGTKNGVGKTIQ